jgi:hypothetical protein
MSITSTAFEHLSPVWPHYTPIIVDHASGCYIYDQDGQAYLDFTSGIGVTNTGHCHPRVVQAIQQQAGLLLHGQANIVTHRPMLELVDELRTIVDPAHGRLLLQQLRRRSGGRGRQAGPPRHRTPQCDRLPGQLPRAHGGHHVADHLQDHLPGRLPATDARSGGLHLIPYAFRYGWSEAETVPVVPG